MAEKECVPVLSSSLKGDKAVAASGSRNEVSGEKRAEGQCPEVLGEGRCYGTYLVERLEVLLILHQKWEITDQIQSDKNIPTKAKLE